MTTRTADALAATDLDISGMTCASCAARIEKKLNKLDGVSASVNYATEKAHVLAPASLTVPDLIRVVRDAGYDAWEPVPDERPVDHAADLKRRLIVAIVLAVPVIAISMIPALQFDWWQWLCAALATPVVFWCGLPFHRAALVNARHGATTMDTLISMGTMASYWWSVYTLGWGSAGYRGMRHHFSLQVMRMDPFGNIYFEASVGIIMFILLGRFIEARARREAGSALQALLEMGAREVTVLRPSGSGAGDSDLVEQTLPITELRVGDRFVVLPGAKVATDGIVVQGHSAVDASLVTGESVPAEVGPGDQVVGATINTTGRLVVRATAVGADTQLAHIARLVEQAQTGKAHAQRLADTVSSIFVPIVIGLALITTLVWYFSGWDIGYALTAGIAVLIIACPCALGLATPTALLAGTGRGAQLGIVIRGPEVLERAQGIDLVVFDKTGTLTTGHMGVREVAGDRAQTLRVAAALEASSEHPIARAILDAARADTEKVALKAVQDVTTVPGRGVQGQVHGEGALAGTQAFLAENGVPLPPELSERAEAMAGAGMTLTWVALGGRAIGLIGVADEIRPDAVRVVDRLREQGITSALVTGDNAGAAAAVAKAAGIDQVTASALPGDKVDWIRERQGGHSIAMVGDGVNDAAALAQADLGIAIGTGTDVAKAASDITLMHPDLGLLVDALRLSRATMRTIRGNLFWAFVYNLAALPIAALGMLNPMLAGAAMAFSSVFVVTNSLRLLRFRRAA